MPLLGTLPFIKNLFSVSGTKKVRREVIVVITPHIIKESSDQLEQLKEGSIINIAPSLYTDSIGVKSNLNVIISDFDTKITNQKEEKIKFIDTST